MKRLITAALAAAVLLLGSLASAAWANTIAPSTTTDDITNNGNCTLREAVQAANKRCVAPTKKLRHAKHCTRTVTLGSFSRNAAAGANGVPFNGRLNGRKLKPGSYRLTASPTDPSGNHGAPASVSFKIVKR
jgi:CSLREA domain-containing protein